MTHLSSQAKTSFTTDLFVSEYTEVESITKAMAADFLTGKLKNKTVFNVADAHNSNNIGGFNLANFKMR